MVQRAEMAGENKLGCTVWQPGRRPVEASSEPPDLDCVRLFDLPPGSDAADAFGQLADQCRGLELEMVERVLSPIAEPDDGPFREGAIRLSAPFSIRAVPAPDSDQEALGEEGQVGASDASGCPGQLVIRPVKLLAGPAWLVSCWHHPLRFSGTRLQETLNLETTYEQRKYVALNDVARAWCKGRARTSADLGVLLMHELSLTYAPTHRKIAEWLEGWELDLYVRDRIARRPIAYIWGSLTLFRRWLAPLNPPGARADIEKAWFSGATDHDEVQAVDSRIDKALGNLKDLADTARTSFGLLQGKLEERARVQRESFQRRVEIIAAIFLVPTLVVGFFGANTWLPGDGTASPGRVTAFIVMLVAIALFTGSAIAVIQRSQRTPTTSTDETSVLDEVMGLEQGDGGAGK